MGDRQFLMPVSQALVQALPTLGLFSSVYSWHKSRDPYLPAHHETAPSSSASLFRAKGIMTWAAMGIACSVAHCTSPKTLCLVIRECSQGAMSPRRGAEPSSMNPSCPSTPQHMSLRSPPPSRKSSGGCAIPKLFPSPVLPLYGL